LARKHCGNQKGWKIGLELLLKKTKGKGKALFSNCFNIQIE